MAQNGMTICQSAGRCLLVKNGSWVIQDATFMLLLVGFMCNRHYLLFKNINYIKLALFAHFLGPLWPARIPQLLLASTRLTSRQWAQHTLTLVSHPVHWGGCRPVNCHVNAALARLLSAMTAPVYLQQCMHELLRLDMGSRLGRLGVGSGQTW